MTDPIQPDPYSENAEGNDAHRDEYKRDVTGSVEVRGAIEPRIPAGLIEAYSADKAREDSRENCRLLLEVVTLFVLTLYAALTAYQGYQSKRSADASKIAANAARDAATASQQAVCVAQRTLTETQISNAAQAALTEKNRVSAEQSSSKALQASIDNFHQEQRAWVGIAPIQTPIIAIFRRPNPPIPHAASPSPERSVELPILNTGKTPALRVEAIVGRYDRRGPPYAPDLNDEGHWMENLVGARKKSDFSGKFFITGKDAESTDMEHFFAPDLIPQGLRDPMQGNTILAPREVPIGALPPSIPFSIDIPGGVSTNGIWTTIFYGEIIYKDISKHERTTTFCNYTSNINEVPLTACPTYNDMQ